MRVSLAVRARGLRVGDVIVARVLRESRGEVERVTTEDGRVFINYTNGSGMTAAVNDELFVLREREDDEPLPLRPDPLKRGE